MNRQIPSIIAAAAVILAAVAKLASGDIININMTEVMLAISTISAAIGFQRRG